MFRGIVRFLGRMAVLTAISAFIVAVSLFVVGAFLLSWPILRLNPRDRKMRAMVELAAMGAGVMGIMRMASQQTDDSETDA